MKRPTFFISSTIQDFRDLRSSLKYYLEGQGCKVLASEFSDFRRPIEPHAHQACLDAIHRADYFVLLIGSRVGGWFDESSKVSITRREYREAYELHKQGKLKLFCFVRAGVWQVWEDRRALARYLESIAIEDQLRADIANFPSRSTEDADFISSFLEEVGRVAETAAAIKSGAPAPTGNWISVFSEFHDLVRVIDGALFASTPVEDLTLKRLLRRELREFLSKCLVKTKDGLVHSPRNCIDRFHAASPVRLKGRDGGATTVDASAWDGLGYLAVSLMGLQLHPVVLNHAVSLPTFLAYDIESDSYRETPVYEALLQLQNEVRLFGRANTEEVMDILLSHSPRNRPSGGRTVTIDTYKLLMFLHLIDRWANVIELSRALLRYLDGDVFRPPALRPCSPVQGMEEQILEERVSERELDEFIHGHSR